MNRFLSRMLDPDRKITLYKRLCSEVVECEYGDKHKKDYYAVRIVRPTGNVRWENNGYGAFQSFEWKDSKGRSYWRWETVDYTNSVFYRMEGDELGPGMWLPNKPVSKAAFDVHGRKL